MADDGYIYYEEIQIMDEGNGEFRISAGVSEDGDLIVTKHGLIAAANAILDHFMGKL